MRIKKTSICSLLLLTLLTISSCSDESTTGATTPATPPDGLTSTDPAIEPPAKPGALMLHTSFGTVKVSWQPVIGAEVYDLYNCTINDITQAVCITQGTTALEYTVTGIVNEQYQYFWLRARNAGGQSEPGPVALAVAPYNAGDKKYYLVQSININMVYVPGRVPCPDGRYYQDVLMAENPYWIGESEVTWQLWKAVYDWAVDPARGTQQYTFAKTGTCGDTTGGSGYPATTEQHPVAEITWRDAMVWCNALTEWYNHYATFGGTGYECVYYADTACTTPIRSVNADAPVENPVAGSQDNPVIKKGARGFRLLTGAEWETAARWEHATAAPGYNFASETSFSGAQDLNNLPDVAWFYLNCNPQFMTRVVKTRLVNTLGLYDMAGNVYEWCQDWTTTNRDLETMGLTNLTPGRMYRGGCYDTGVGYAMGTYFFDLHFLSSGVFLQTAPNASSGLLIPPYPVRQPIGFRLARTH